MVQSMKPAVAGLISLCFFAFSATSVFAGGGGSSSNPLEGSNPIVLSHGLFGWGEDSGGVISIANYWGGMDDYMRSQGAVVYAPTKSAAQSNEVRGQQLKDKINYWMAANGHSKVNIMGHSQGGLDSRYMISNLGMKNKTGVLTTISTPHRGSPIADIAKAVIPDWLEPFVGAVLNGLVKIIWSGSEQDALAALNSLTKNGMSAFNSYTPNASGVKYYSYTSKMAWADFIQHPLLALLHPACYAGGLFQGQGGANDGLVPVSSAKWGTYKGQPSYSWWVTGIDHLQITNTLYTGQAYFDVEGFFLKMAKNAKDNQ